MTAYDEHGKQREIRAQDWHARILQHEVDHLQGKLYIDCMESRSLTMEGKYKSDWAGKPVAEMCNALGVSPTPPRDVDETGIDGIRDFVRWLGKRQSSLASSRLDEYVEEFSLGES